jgi:hypothetical protein
MSGKQQYCRTGAKKQTVDILKRQAELLEVNRSSVYRKHPVKTISDEELFIMRLIDEIHTAEPTLGLSNQYDYSQERP